MRALLASDFELQFEHGTTFLRAPDGDAVWRLWNESHRLTVARMKALDEEGQKAFRDVFITFHEQYRTDAGIVMPRDYIVAIGSRR